jgi:hypothetical protein
MIYLSLPQPSPCFWVLLLSAAPKAGQGGITDLTSTNLVNLRRTIYLTIMSALDFEEAGHKLLKMVRGSLVFLLIEGGEFSPFWLNGISPLQKVRL